MVSADKLFTDGEAYERMMGHWSQAMRGFWEMAGLEAIETRVIRIPVTFADFDDFRDSNAVPVGPQGKAIAGMSPGARDQLRTRLRERLPAAPRWTRLPTTHSLML
jgi:hypothetical protein